MENFPLTQVANGEGNIIAGRDVNLNQGKQFFESLSPDVGRFGVNGSYLPPTFAAEMEANLVDNHLLIVSGNPTFQKNAFLRYLANRVLTYRTSLEIIVLQQSNEMAITIQDLLSRKDLDGPKVLVIDDATPTLMLGNIIQVAQVAKSHGHYVIASSQQGPTKWGLKKEFVGKLWFDIPAGRVVGEDSLIRHLSLRLQTDAMRMRALAHLRLQADFEQLIGRAARNLQSPEQCEAFIELLRYEEEPADENRFLELAKVAGGDTSAYMHIYHERLPEKAKLLLMAAALFKGLDETQFFKMTDELVKNGWEYRAIELKALDYCDLEAIKEFYAFDRKTENSLLNSSYDQIDITVLAESRFGYRRHLVKALELIVQTIATSGSRAQVADNTRMRRRLSESLAKLLLVARQDAELKLEELSRASNYNGKPNAAHAIAYLRELDSFGLMLTLVDNWLGGSDRALQQVAITAISIASRMDPPNRLAPEIKGRLIAAARHENNVVRNHLKEQMPRLLELHPIQMAEEIVQNILVQHNVQEKSDYFEPIALGLAQAAYNYPEDVWRLIDTWLTKAESGVDRSGKGQHTSGRDRLLIIALLTLQRLQNHPAGVFPPYERTLNRLTLLREKEVQPAVRGELMATILELLNRINQLDAVVWQKLMAHSIPAEQLELLEALAGMLSTQRLSDPAPYVAVVMEAFQKAETPAHRIDMLKGFIRVFQYLRPQHAALCTTWLSGIAHKMYKTEIPYLVRMIGRIYLFEREQFRQGDFTFTVLAHEIPSFMRGRDETQIERDMHFWIASEDRLLRRIGLLAFMEFGVLCDLQERNLQKSWVPPTPVPSLSGMLDANGEAIPDADASETDSLQGSGGKDVRTTGSNSNASLGPILQYRTPLPLSWRFWGCISVMFAPKADRQRFWQALGTIHRKPNRYDGDAVQFSLQRIANSNLSVGQQLVVRVRRLQAWLTTFSRSDRF